MKMCMRSFTLILLFALLALAAPGSGAPMRGVYQGIVVDENGDPLPYTNILIQELNIGCTSDINGRFTLRLPPGRFSVRISYIGHKSAVDSLSILPDRTIERRYVLPSTALQIGGIQVIADEELLPISPETQSRIHSGEIEHMQASSLNDIMELTPGVETSNPTLNTPEQLSIRGGDAIGAQVIVNGVPVSNTANMQIGIGYSTANSGYDLRSIPAENVQEVRVIRGIPSAQYGDLADGVMVVTTKETADPLRIKFKYNPHLYETNVSAGKRLGTWIVNGNFNVAFSEHDVRVEGDGYTRLAGEIGLSRGNERFELKNRFYVTRTLDESKEKPGYALREAWYNRDVNLKWTTTYRRNYSPQRRLSVTASANYIRQNSYKQQLVSRDNLVMSDRTSEGTQEGRIVFGSYLGKKWIKGNVWNVYSDLQYQHRLERGRLIHSLSAGLTGKIDLNNGEGIVFDPLFPPSLSVTTPRLRRYDELPVYPVVNFYFEDKITGRVWKPFTLQLGARYESYRPTGIDFSGLWSSESFLSSHNGSFLNPRLNFSMSLLPKTQIRLGMGQTSKSPPMG
ncbi:TonB-dependent receptor, partial [candidate division KSB1 bacterium]|nr:TonB-dependent receptor [candidate division KSB1 bacterium]